MTGPTATVPEAEVNADVQTLARLPSGGRRALVRRLAFLAVFALVTLAALWIAVLSEIESEREQEIRATYRETANLARAFEEHVRRTLRYVDRIALQAQRLAERQGTPDEWERIYEQVAFRDEAVTLIAMANPHGDIVRSSRTENGLNISARESFLVHKSQATSEPYIGKPLLGDVSKKWVIPITRRINNPDGSFGGVITVDIAAHYFSDYYGRLDLGTRGMVSLVGRDGVVRARQSGSDQTLGQDVSGSTLLLLAGERTDGTFYSPYRIDAVPRYVGFRALSDYPLLVLVARAQDDALAAVNARKATYLLVASGISLLILGFCAALARGVFKDHRALRQSEIARAERERTLDKLRNAELRTRQLIESLPEAIIMTSQGVIQYVNGATVQLFGVASAADMTGRRITDFTDSKDAALVAEKTLAFNQAPLRIPIWELRMLKTDGTAFDAEIASISFLDNEAFTVQHIIRDITPRKQSEIEIQVAQELLELRVSERTAQLEAANCELETFSYAVSHDLHAPLRAVGGFAQILEEHLNGRLDDEGRRLLGRIRTGAQRMGSLIDSLLQFSRTGRGALVVLEVDLEEIFASVVADIQLAYPDSLVRIGALPRIRGDATLLREVVANLLDNAFKYSSKAAHPKIDIGQMSLEQGSAIFVRDNGAGFDSGNAEQLFTPFRRLHSESEFPGSGIGLALCKRIIDRHGGRIWAESTPGQGASFFFTLDADSPPTAADGPLSG